MSYREWDDLDDQTQRRWLRVVLLIALGLFLIVLLVGCASAMLSSQPAPLPGTTVVDRCPPCPTPAPIPPFVLELPPPGLCEDEVQALERALEQCMTGIAERDAALGTPPPS